MISINSRPQDAYRQQDILTANPIDVIVMLYDALKKNIILGQKKIAKGDIQGSHNHLIKAQQIVTELVNSLDMSIEMSETLLALYTFMLKSLEEANMKKDAEPLDAVREMVEELREAWNEISVLNKGNLYLKEG
jgi:flagellar protein FliS